MTVGLIVAADPRGVIGVGGKIPWHYPEDLARFKDLTMGGILVMGRRTWDSIGRPLPGRLSRVVTRNPDFRPEGAEVYQSLAEAVLGDLRPVWVIGGGEVYREAIEAGMVDFIDMTEVPWVPLVDTGVVTFPGDLLDGFRLVETERGYGPLVHRRYVKK